VASRVEDLDVAAARATAAVAADAPSQLAVLGALAALSAALGTNGVARGLVDDARAARHAAFSAFHERRIESASTREEIAAAYDEAIAFTRGAIGDGDEVRVLADNKARALATTRPPRPFFARFLEKQDR